MDQNTTIYQLFIIAVATIALITNITKFKRNVENRSMVRFLLINLFWLGVLIIISYPSLAHTVSVRLGMGENFNTLIFTTFILIFIIILKLFSSIENLERDITELVRERALTDLPKKRKRTKSIQKK